MVVILQPGKSIQIQFSDDQIMTTKFQVTWKISLFVILYQIQISFYLKRLIKDCSIYKNSVYQIKFLLCNIEQKQINYSMMNAKILIMECHETKLAKYFILLPVIIARRVGQFSVLCHEHKKLSQALYFQQKRRCHIKFKASNLAKQVTKIRPQLVYTFGVCDISCINALSQNDVTVLFVAHFTSFCRYPCMQAIRNTRYMH